MTTERSLRTVWLWAAAIYYLGGISVLSHIPGQTIVELGFDLWDKAAHFGVYLPIGLCVGLAVRQHPSLSRLLITALLAGAAGAVLGVLDELHQSFVPGRFCAGSDVVADVLGVVCGAGAVAGLSRWRSRTT